MQITAPSLLFGLSLRILFNKFVYHYENSSIADYAFLGLWQGTAVYLLLMLQAEFAWAAAVGILGRLLFDFAQDFNTSKCACTLLGVALGVLITDILSQFIDDGGIQSQRVEGRSAVKQRNHRLVQFSRSYSRDMRRERKESHRGRDKRPLEPAWEARSIMDAKSISSSSDLVDPRRPMTALEREVATLRARASLADTERRRFKEEKKWALSQGNTARASQMSWQVRRYAALVESFHREADAIRDASSVRPRQNSVTPAPPKPIPRTSGNAEQPISTVVNIDFGHAPRKRRSSGTIKPTIRVQGKEIRDPGPSNQLTR